jgi:ABC-type thiamine transport system ATPase subunit
MYLNDFSKITLRKNVIFDALYRPNMVLQENHFLKYLKIPQNMTLCTEPSQGLKPVDLRVFWKRLSIKLFGNFFCP